MSAPRRIAVGVDGSEDSRRALQWAAALLDGRDGEIIAVHALGLLAHLGSAIEPSQGHRRDTAARLEHDWSRPLTDAEVNHRCLVVDGDPVNALLRLAHDEAADLIVVGRRGTGGRPGLVIGSTSQQLVHQADRPVVVVPATEPASTSPAVP